MWSFYEVIKNSVGYLNLEKRDAGLGKQRVIAADNSNSRYCGK